jgi:DNA-binding MarR family transcriptional regulator
MSNHFRAARKSRVTVLRVTVLPPTDVLDSLPTQLARLYHGFVAVVDRLRAEAADKLPNFRPGAGTVYFTILQHEGCTAAELTALLKMPKGTLSGLLDGLERDGVILRTACENDGRAVRLRLTRFGRSLEKGLCARHQQAIDILQEGLSPAESAELQRMLRLVLGNLERIRETGLAATQPRRAATRRKAA